MLDLNLCASAHLLEFQCIKLKVMFFSSSGMNKHTSSAYFGQVIKVDVVGIRSSRAAFKLGDHAFRAPVNNKKEAIRARISAFFGPMNLRKKKKLELLMN